MSDPETTGDTERLTVYQPSHADYTEAELLENAQGNAQALILATIAFLSQRQVPLDEWAVFLGEQFARSWGEPHPWDADEFLDAILANYRALGATISATDFSPDRSQATFNGFPQEDLIDLFGIEPGLAATIHGAAAAIAAERGLDFTWQVNGPETTLTCTRRQRSAEATEPAMASESDEDDTQSAAG